MPWGHQTKQIRTISQVEIGSDLFFYLLSAWQGAHHAARSLPSCSAVFAIDAEYQSPLDSRHNFLQMARLLLMDVAKKLSSSGQWRAKRAEHQKSSVRAKVEHVFAVIKGQFRYRKTRYRGLSKQTAKLNMLFALANLVLADRRCPAV